MQRYIFFKKIKPYLSYHCFFLLKTLFSSPLRIRLIFFKCNIGTKIAIAMEKITSDTSIGFNEGNIL